MRGADGDPDNQVTARWPIAASTAAYDSAVTSRPPRAMVALTALAVLLLAACGGGVSDTSPTATYEVQAAKKCLEAIRGVDVQPGVRSLPTDAPSLVVADGGDDIAHILFGEDHEHASALRREFGGSDSSSVRGNVLIRWAAGRSVRKEVEACFP